MSPCRRLAQDALPGGSSTVCPGGSETCLRVPVWHSVSGVCFLCPGCAGRLRHVAPVCSLMSVWVCQVRRVSTAQVQYVHFTLEGCLGYFRVHNLCNYCSKVPEL